ncbi:hypothetical protein J4476_01205 [Candidatus Woesearchaeota archaeon]|nr:MAG: hypothetical protein QT09_C0014G0070 [archaeon GW2011_AR18]MBS3161295.1 hypothetical protein [Candidatus Woesearchaeota archaeon]HIH25755.1 hypothetical protein [Nanoarchaeota archaeon]
MGFFNFLGFGNKEDDDIESLIEKVSNVYARKELRILYSEISLVRAEKNRLPNGKSLSNRVVLLMNQDVKSYKHFTKDIIPIIRYIPTKILSLLSRCSKNKTILDQRITQWLNLARIEFERDSDINIEFEEAA